MTKFYVDLKVLASLGEDDYLVSISKEILSFLTSFDESLIVRHWDGASPIILEPYGLKAVRTQEDASTDNNLSELPNVDVDGLLKWLKDTE